MMPECCKQTRTLWVNFYAKGNGSIHMSRETADDFAKYVDENPRIACRPVAAMIGDGLGRKQRQAHE